MIKMLESGNVLLPGKYRTGTLISDNPLLNKKQVPIRVTEAGVEVTVAWQRENQISSLWYGDEISLNESDRNKIPRNLWFHDADGSIALLGCRGASLSQQMLGYGGGQGTIIANRAIIGAALHSDYQQVYGLRTSIDGLREWIGKSCVMQDPHTNEAGLLKSETLTIRSPEDIPLNDNPSVSIRFAWTVSRNDDIWKVNDKAYIETKSSEPLTWQRAEHLHKALQDLLRISYGEDRDLTESLVLRSSNPKVSTENKVAYEKWLPVIRELREHHKPKRHNCLIPYNLLKKDNIQEWFSLYDRIPRAIDPLVTSFTLDKVTAEARLFEASIGMEALGYYLLIRDGKSKDAAGRTSFKDRLGLISKNLRDILPFDVSDWIQQTTSAYNGVKHANRDRPDLLMRLNSWRKTVLVFRCWIALELGIEKGDLKDLVSVDSMRNEYKLL
ncbi:HEPN domain-containing protein [Bifidobacterium coryneforme]|nr:HEPN domain-containing protein [Bifidobacterium indicum]